MNILLVSQCSKKALQETRRIIDQFAERTGDRTWQTAITEQGLATLRKLLKKTARRNTSVACHWIRSSNRTDLKWIVGNPRRFNSEGTVPTNVTGRDILRAKDENVWHTAEDIRLLACIAALFHDVGKANQAFQDKINPRKKTGSFEPYRHEWVSLRVFEAFVTTSITGVESSQQDHAWLTALTQIDGNTDDSVQEALIKDGLDKSTRSPFRNLPPVAQTVAWLILSHHKLPEPEKTDKSYLVRPQRILSFVSSPWNSPQSAKDWSPKEIETVWTFPKGTPFRSQVWRDRLARVAAQAIKRSSFTKAEWLSDPFSLHLSRLSLMLADHYYSGQNRVGQKSAWHDPAWGKAQKDIIFANTWRERGTADKGKYNQTLDDHLIGVYHHSHQMVRKLPSLKESLPVITRHPELKKRTANNRFAWQNKAYELAVSVRDTARQHGFFGVNMASTGMGKTFANARIMYGLADERKGCRFSVALGLRALTLQTGDAFKELLKLDEEDLAVMIGSKAVKALHDDYNQQKTQAAGNQQEQVLGSESANDFADQDSYVSYEGALGDGFLSKWLESSPKINKLVNAPVLVSTIDHLMPATEGSRGGKQIAPMLRLLTSDLVLDEPDDFGLEDLPGLCRLVHWAGLLGSHVLLSSATLPPDLIEALFDAYKSGRTQYEKAIRVNPSSVTNIVCAWFDEFKSTSIQAAQLSDFRIEHKAFITKRSAKLSQQAVRRRVELVTLEPVEKAAIIDEMATKIHQSILTLHDQYHHSHPSKQAKASFGLVRMANINQLVATAKQLMAMPSPDGVQIHYCVYHSQYLLLQRSSIEHMLDTVLNRKDPNAIWQQPSVRDAIDKAPEKQHIFVVLGSPVTEVGRDHSYDWAVVEPSSIRSLIQLAGRVLRHDQVTTVDQPNIHLLNQNWRALRGDEISYMRPGFESKSLRLQSHLLERCIEPSEYQTINALPRIQKATELNPNERFVDLEHVALGMQLWGTNKPSDEAYASLWWQQPMHWTSHLQKLLPFRRHTPTEDYCYYIEDEFDEPLMHRWHDNGELKLDDKQSFQRDNCITLAQGISVWGGAFDYSQQINELAERLTLTLADATIQFGSVNLRRDSDKEVWQQSGIFGFYKVI
ncbi:CRISPR-associated nuclease/helicase Cas3 subtype I-F/YPEST [Marinomonas gallaica]|uniref:CRISPR-associated nuclease/helicase Cas3 subtype I-F/YPEST n=1 Tax=Marinomonas gallaica TaxID=1806667 RepID=A0A1C3JSD9_9GAMM|nr:type I-F CRISPR-associated helicase Cas3f [Marinomonas gallaica]SBT18143.1 CRISPR-associated nuclease/helicase Cas3 subtype I-F/YPEST [Marinomonas gallaica]SBT22523.1 CRISPR-associated nuclease/helicase Cas3 subtype I-F/YPEST [Marinomonas gallaica]